MTDNLVNPAPAGLPRIGDDVVLGAPTTEAPFDARLADHDLELADWHLATRPDRGADR